jgi:hypothetical protein
VNGREKVVSAPNHGATSTWLKRFSEKIEKLVLVISAEDELGPVFQSNRMLAVE